MKTEVTELPESRVKIDVAIEPDQLAKRIDRAAAELAAAVGGSDVVERPARRPTVDEEFADVTPFARLLAEAGGDSVR